jgi:hypothetical protein
MGQAIRHLDLVDRLLAQVEEEPSTTVDRKANTSKETSMVEIEAAAAIYLADADRVEKLLDIISNTANWPNVPCIRQAAQNELAQIEADLRAQLYPEQVAAEEAALKAVQEAEEARKARLKEEAAEQKKLNPPPPPPQGQLERRI